MLRYDVVMRTLIIFLCSVALSVPSTLHAADVAIAIQRQAGTDEIGLYRYLTLAAVDEDGEQDLARPSVVKNFIHRRAHRATRLQHVVDQYDAAIVDVGRQAGRLYRGVQTIARKVITVKGYVEASELSRGSDALAQLLGNPYTAGFDAND